MFFPPNFSASIPSYLQEKDIFPKQVKQIKGDESLILVDVSNRAFLENECQYPIKNITKIYDHHFESFDFWKTEL